MPVDPVTPARATARDPHADPAGGSMLVLARRLFTELFGTFALVSVDCGGAMIAALSGGEVTPVARSLATGLLIMALAYAVGDVSGAHFNPAVTLAFATRRVFPWARVPMYWAAQLAGALLGSLFLRTVLGDVEKLGATVPHFGAARALAVEVFLTFLLVAVALGTATRHRILGPNAAIAAGGTVAMCSLFARPISGASMNPARSLAPAVLSGTMSDAWIYVVGPVIGALLATATMGFVHARRHESELEAAAGEKK